MTVTLGLIMAVASAFAQLQCFTGGCVYKKSSTIYWTGKLDTDTDGAARSYHPGDTGIDYLANAGSPGNWYGVLTSGGSPVVQDSNDPAPGYYVSTTAMYASKARSTSQCHYVDAERLSYLVLPGSSSFRSNAGFGMGDFGLVYYAHTGRMAYTFYGDSGPSSKIGEGSVALQGALGVNVWNSAHTRVLSGVDGGVTQLVFTGTGFGNGYVPTNRDTNAHGAGAFAAAGGCSLLNQIVGSTVSGCSTSAPAITADVDYDCKGAYGVFQTCGSAGGACASNSVCTGWGGSWSSGGGCAGGSNIGCCSVSGYAGFVASPSDQASSPSAGVPCTFGGVRGACVTHDMCGGGTWTSSNSGASGCENEAADVRCCTSANAASGSALAPTTPSGPVCKYKGMSGGCVASCSGGAFRSSRQGAKGCEAFASNIKCCLSAAQLIDDTSSGWLASSSGAGNTGLIVGVVVGVALFVALLVAIIVFFVVRRNSTPPPSHGQGAAIEFQHAEKSAPAFT